MHSSDSDTPPSSNDAGAADAPLGNTDGRAAGSGAAGRPEQSRLTPEAATFRPPLTSPVRKMSPQEAMAWQQSQVKDLWRVFRIMSEFVEGFETLSRLGPSVSVFGSARTQPGHEYYELARTVAAELVKRDYGIITGGGPGIMQAANQGAHEAGGVSVGLNIDIPHEQVGNEYVDPDRLINFDFFFVRKVMFIKYAQGFIVLPGGFGTMDELFEALTLIQTGKSTRFPVVLVGTAFWSGLVDWLKSTMLEAGNISPGNLDLFRLTDDPVEAVEIVDAFYKEHALSPNF